MCYAWLLCKDSLSAMEYTLPLQPPTPSEDILQPTPLDTNTSIRHAFSLGNVRKAKVVWKNHQLASILLLTTQLLRQSLWCFLMLRRTQNISSPSSKYAVIQKNKPVWYFQIILTNLPLLNASSTFFLRGSFAECDKNTFINMRKTYTIMKIGSGISLLGTLLAQPASSHSIL